MKYPTRNTSKDSHKGIDSWLLLPAAVLLAVVNLPVHAKLLAEPALPDFCDPNALKAFPELPGSLKCTPAPEPYMLDTNGEKHSIYPDIVKNKAALIALGKMLFWDNQVGSDGIACASCHFQAGADNRIKNQINPGQRNASGELASDNMTPIGNVFDFMPTAPLLTNLDPLYPSAGKGANYTLKREDFPLKQYREAENPVPGQPLQADRHAEVLFDSDDIVSSQGVFPSVYTSLVPAGRKEICEKKFPLSGMGTPIFNVAGHSVRQVAPRNTPTVINAVYNFRNFWDGRANNVFNGLDPFGMRRFANQTLTPASEIYVKQNNGSLAVKRLAILNSSLASQAVGPALSDVEMSCADKNFRELGKKMVMLRPLARQIVDTTDSVLGSYAKQGGGLNSIYTYKNLIQTSFNDSYWNVPDTQLVNGYKLIENNFSLFWGLAIQAYEATLVSNDSRFDQAMENPAAVPTLLTEQEQRGFGIFMGKGKCLGCHSGSEFTAASVKHVENSFNIQDDGKYIERMMMGDGGLALYDSGFYNIGVRPTKEDIGLGGTDGYGFPLSFSRNAIRQASDPSHVFEDDMNSTSLVSDPFKVNTSLMDSQAGCVWWNPETTVSGYLCGDSPIARDERDAVDGSFKAPSLRNVELTGPYFHNGGQATLEQVVQFYNRGGDRKDHFQKGNSECKEGVVQTDNFGNQVLVPGDENGLIDSTGFLANGNRSNLDTDIAGSRDPFAGHCDPANPGITTVEAAHVEIVEPLDPQATIEDPEVTVIDQMLAMFGLTPVEEVPEVETNSPQTLKMTQAEVDDLVAFMKSLTDERVRMEKAPFDHPSLTLPNGHVGDEVAVKFNAITNQAMQESIVLPAVGAAGRAAKGLPGLQAFESGLQ
jgi:cytochrome c peroxidase